MSALFGAGMQRHLNSGRHVVVIHGDGCIVGFASYSDHRAQRFDEQEPGDTTEHTNTVNVAP
ncbi:MAG: hypothetical protein ABI574_04580 [Burkholderiales bacterium]